MSLFRSRALLGGLSAFLLFSIGSQALALEAPTGPVILVVSGHITETNVGSAAHFDSAMLQALEQHETVTGTPWHEGRVTFNGPLGRSLLETVGAQGDTMKVTALNDYSSNIPVTDFERHDVILAMSADGRRLRVRDQGPLFVIYPFDEEPSLLNEEVIHRSVWQVKAIEIQ
ncbi:molybdopterin-dependent oxidoreductase [Halomonas sp. McH1-25]|uniref:molybdopterin-dependent oxidoreductase n=1 Tax=unclassified Halomonas TaxID=2609666 RepID=UPI001EF420FA|nr:MULTISPECIES: molybdopterin-dependent oxidoreductase [unclassified Halomonas]MCG7599379.1 molybdopterin-dependent oxidoreductase [Halomonas sp. McH1-25]MCP1344111.1 molybdopterin-dependent oxidoreductase [Halomonas sp. FL8]MCP1362646.1 molybdopterin-dependent oxidoreductase [Halomonas sp. BBD45]MCP1367618.1 molybdopterin-dependent oxidoreductase [Halomonas sp. BBD48]